MIFSFIMFAGEFRLLDLRLAEELPVIDRLIAAEATHTFTGIRKPLQLHGSPQYEQSGLETVAVTFSDSDPWMNESAQRNAAMRRLESTDVAIVSDADEIHRRQDIPLIVDAARRHGFVRIVQHFHYYKINLFGRGNWNQWSLPFAASGGFLSETGMTFHLLRLRYRRGATVQTDGHHFDYLLTPQEIAAKLAAFSHQEYNRPPFTDPDHIAQRIELGEDLFGREPGQIWRPGPVDERFPQSILDNLDDWREWIAGEC